MRPLTKLLVSVSLAALFGKRCDGQCLEGWFTKANASRIDANNVRGCECLPCKQCERGEKIIQNCTKNSDTKCGNLEMSTPSSPLTTDYILKPSAARPDINYIAVSVTASALVTLILFTAVWKWRATPKSSAKEPHKINLMTI